MLRRSLDIPLTRRAFGALAGAAALGIAPTRAQGAPCTVGTWGGMLAPAGTPAAIVAKLNADARRALAEPDVVAKFESIGLEIRPGSPEDFAQLIRADSDKWAKLIKERNLKFGQ